jgi:hypothetical protein
MRLSGDVLAEIIATHDGVCDLCDRPATDTDHCHRARRYRGRLCGSCNRGLGLFRDNVRTLLLAADYIEHFESNQWELTEENLSDLLK